MLQKLHQARIKNKGTWDFQRCVSLLLAFSSGNENHFLDWLPRLFACSLCLCVFFSRRVEGKAPSAMSVQHKEFSCLGQCITFPEAFLWLR